MAPLLHVKLIGPAGMRAVVYQGMARPRDLPGPVQLGLRPGYIYRLELNGFKQDPNLSLFPTLEVRGTLAMPPGLSAAPFPAPVVITEDDVRQALAGGLVTKVIYVEHGERAAPAATTPEQPLEATLPPDHDLLCEARELGRPVLILRLGQVILTPQEVARSSVPGTVLFPGERVLGPPAAPPMLPFVCFQWYDPILGPLCPEEEWIHNGCVNPPSPRYLVNGQPFHPWFDADEKLRGLNPEDAVAEYRDARGRKKLSCSNRVCLFVPRFAVLRNVLGLGRYDNVVAVAGQRDVLGGELLETRVPPLFTRQIEFARAAVQRTIASEIEVVDRTVLVGHVEGGLQIVSEIVGVRDLTSTPGPPPGPPERCLLLKKEVDKHTALPGEVVTFTLTFSNHGGLPMTDVAVVDSLSGRLEYVPGSWKSDRDAVFTLQPNEAGSQTLRWDVAGRLLPGESGVIRFQARVR
jgi:uncharacterized repeat protein (TIGR01451 family)